MALLCESQSSGGGESILASAEDLYHHLLETCGREALMSLFEPFFQIQRAGLAVTRPLFTLGKDGRIRFAYRYGDPAIKVKVEPRYRPVLDEIQSFLGDPDKQLCHALEPGCILIIDNTRLLHGRRAFQGPRRLLRLWFEGNAEGGGLGLGFRVKTGIGAEFAVSPQP